MVIDGDQSGAIAADRSRSIDGDRSDRKKKKKF